MIARRFARLPELLRFGLVSAGGLGIDAAISLGTTAGFGIPLTLGALIGFSAGALFNYACHELWTFGGAGRASLQRGTVYISIVLATLGVRLATLQLLLMTVDAPPALLFAVSVGLSFTTNYLLSRLLFGARKQAY
ncbi:GtrA family protein [Sphingomonadaceae bacterium G21617-S1]|nr:GtrA family protein [Sphingomonadaceae bacterium G21617-S1]